MNKSFVKCNANDFLITLTPQAPLALKAEVLHISKIFYVSPVDCSFFQSINDSPAHCFFFSLQVGRLAVSVFQCAGFLIILLIWSFFLSVCYSFHNFVHLSVRRSFVRFIRVSVGLHVCLFVRPAISLYISSFVCLSVCLSAGLCQSVCLFVRLSLHYFDFFSQFCGILFCSIILSILLLTLNLGPC